MSEGFWSKFWDNYCEVTHFHGFLEMHRVKNRWNRSYWTICIISGFVLAISLVILGVNNNLEDPVNSLVTFSRNGELNMPVLYCPEPWIDLAKLAEINATESDLYYALSYLRQYKLVHSYDVIFQIYGGNDWDKDKLNMRTSPIDPIFLVDATGEYLRHLPIPVNYIEDSSVMVKSLQDGSAEFPSPYILTTLKLNDYTVYRNGFLDFYLLLLHYYNNETTEDLFDFVYQYLPIGFFDIEKVIDGEEHIYGNVIGSTLWLKMKNSSDAMGQIISTINKTISSHMLAQGSLLMNMTTENIITEEENPPSEFGCITIDIMEIMNRSIDDLRMGLWASGWTEEEISYYIRKFIKDILQSITGAYVFRCQYLFNYFARKVSELKLRRDTPGKRFWIERMLTLLFSKSLFHSTYDSYKKNKTWEMIKADSSFQAFTSNHPEYGVDTRRALADYLMEANSSRSELERLVTTAESKFLEDEERNFNETLTRNSFNNAFDLLMNISVDLNQFMVWISLLPDQMAAPTNLRIAAKKVMTGRGVCLHLDIHVPPRKEQIAGMRSYQHLHTLYKPTHTIKDYYVSILPLDNSSHSQTLGLVGAIAFGDDVEDIFPGMQFWSGISDPMLGLGVSHNFRLSVGLPTKDWSHEYEHFKISSMEMQQRISKRGSPCKTKTKAGRKYNLNNCMIECENYHFQPRIVKTAAYRFSYPVKMNCYFGKEVMESIKLGLKMCSYFNVMKSLRENFKHYKLTDWNTDIMENSAHSECVKSCHEPCNSVSMRVEQTSGRSGWRRNNLINTVVKMYEYVLNMSELMIPPPDQIIFVNWSYEEIDYYLKQRNLLVRKLIQLQIDSDNMTYREKEAFTWDSMFGIVGGQIGLVTGASCLTFIQLFWVLGRTAYQLIRRSRMRSYSMHDVDNISENAHFAYENGDYIVEIEMEDLLYQQR